MAAINDILRATVKGSLASLSSLNMVFHYVVITGSETDYGTLVASIGAALVTAFGGMEGQISDQVNMSEVDLSEWDAVDSEFDGKSSGVAGVLVGTNAGVRDISGASIVMRFVTEELRRQARKFVPGCLEANINNDALQSPILTPALASVALLNDDIISGGATLRPCTFNSTVGSPRFGTHSKFTQTAFVNALIGYQRRRQPGSGA